MTHTIREKHKLLARVRRIRGQVEALERVLSSEAGCDEVMHQIVGIRGAVTGLMAEVVEDHVRTHLVNPSDNAVALDTRAAEQLIDVMHSYLK
jgi:DNA-binding FrmR family transcriptional regulator